jgi:hypothetical protein
MDRLGAFNGQVFPIRLDEPDARRMLTRASGLDVRWPITVHTRSGDARQRPMARMSADAVASY